MNTDRKCKPKLSYFEHEALKVKQCKRKRHVKQSKQYASLLANSYRCASIDVYPPEVGIEPCYT